MKNDCLFCRIVKGEIPAAVIYSDDHLVAFTRHQSAGPAARADRAAPAHREPERAHGRDEALVGELVRRAARSRATRGYADGGFRTVFNTNADAGQTVFHIHLHLLAGRRSQLAAGIKRVEGAGFLFLSFCQILSRCLQQILPADRGWRGSRRRGSRARNNSGTAGGSPSASAAPDRDRGSAAP